MIWDNGDLFLSILDNIKDKKEKEAIKIVEQNLRSLIAKGNVSITEMKFIRIELLKASKDGNLEKFQRICQMYKLQEITQVRDRRLEYITSLPQKHNMILMSSINSY